MSAAAVTRHFVRVGEREVHYRRAGKGPPFVLFHSSPQSAAFVMPALLPLAEQWTLIGFDTPGYGGSDPLAVAAPSAADYADAAAEAMSALGIERAPIYGTHTGAHIALELARRQPARVAGLVLDGVSFNTREEAKERYDRYAPEFTPSADGAHLAWAWQHTRDQIVFYPWFRSEKARRLDAAMAPADYIHDIVLWKMAAAGYWLGYRAAFSHDSRATLYQVGVKATVVAKDGDVLAPEARRLADLPPHIRVLEAAKETWLDAIRDSLVWCEAGDAAVAEAPVPDPRERTWRAYAVGSGGQRLVRRGGPEGGRPIVFLHGDMSGSRVIQPMAESIAAGRPFLAPDIAGNAESDPLLGAPTLDDYAADVRELVGTAGFDAYDVCGGGVGAALALELARQDARVNRVILNRPVSPLDAERADYLANYAPPIEARWDGTHFLTAWHMLRDRAFFWPWYRRSREAIRRVEPQIDPARLQLRLIEWLKGRRTYGDYVRACLVAAPGDYGAVRQPVLVASVAGDRIEADARRYADALPNAARSEWTGGVAGMAATFAAFLDG